MLNNIPTTPTTSTTTNATNNLSNLNNMQHEEKVYKKEKQIIFEFDSKTKGNYFFIKFFDHYN